MKQTRREFVRTTFSEACSGSATLSLQADKMYVRMIDNDGKLVYATTLTSA